jgi:hypothetical protein
MTQRLNERALGMGLDVLGEESDDETAADDLVGGPETTESDEARADGGDDEQ